MCCSTRWASARLIAAMPTIRCTRSNPTSPTRARPSSGDRVRISAQLIDGDAKRFHFFLRMTMADGGEQVATFEMVVLHVAMANPKATPFPAAIQARLDAMLAAHRALPLPPEVGRKVGLKR